ncbi:MAG TPA: hypothetical protein VGL97_02610 [Bryobacteraceae bacterium]
MKKLIFTLLVPASLLATQAPSDTTVIVPSLKGLVFVAAPKDVQQSGVTTPGLSLAAIPLLNQPEFRQELASYIGQPLTSDV